MANTVPTDGLNTYLTIHEVAAHLRVSDRTVRRWIHAGRLDAIRTSASCSGRLRISQAAVESFVRSLTSSRAANLPSTLED